MGTVSVFFDTNNEDFMSKTRFERREGNVVKDYVEEKREDKNIAENVKGEKDEEKNVKGTYNIEKGYFRFMGGEGQSLSYTDSYGTGLPPENYRI